MDKNIKKVIEELYELDDSLREHAPEIEKIVTTLIASRPDAVIDAAFASKLRDQLMNDTSKQVAPGPVLLGGPFLTKAFGFMVLLLAVLIVGDTLLGSGEVTTVVSVQGEGIARFDSEDEYTAYMEAGVSDLSPGFGGGGFVTTQEISDVVLSFDSSAPRSESSIALKSTNLEREESFDGRVSGTNVQVLSIDEPDIVKTNGSEIYFSNEGYGQLVREVSFIDELSFPAPDYVRETLVIDVSDPEDLDDIAEIDRSGEMLLIGDRLVVFSGGIIWGYDVSDPQNPEEIWEMELDGSMRSARLYNDELYIVSQTWNYNDPRPCPLRPVEGPITDLIVRCDDIYHPVAQLDNPATFHAFKVNPQDGDIIDNVSFVGSSSNSVVYMSENGLYITYTYYENASTILTDYIVNESDDIFPADVVDKIDEINGYDITANSKINEIERVISRYRDSLDARDQRNLENDLGEGLTQYIKDRVGSLQLTGIVKLDLRDLDVDAQGTVPGGPLNQFALDEHKGNLRIATTINANNQFRQYGVGTIESSSGIYILDDDLDIIGSVTDLGITERIYSARFVGDTGYLVTFKQVDPFYVIDLSNPRDPEVKGELKIPGFSSYLHPLSDDIILGIGQENRRVKLSLFDVSDPSNPEEIDKFTLDAGWSEVSNNHHAFLLDKEHGVFFMPAGADGYVFSYENDELEIEAVVEGTRAKRAIYIDDNMFVIGEERIVVLDENDWEEIESYRIR